MNTQSSLTTQQVPIPTKIWIAEGGLLAWKYGRDWVYRTPGNTAVEAFARLGAATDAEILKFASHYGVLNGWQIASHYAFLEGGQIQDDDDEPGVDMHCFFINRQTWRVNHPGFYGPDSGTEPLKLWRHIARRFRAILRISTALKGKSRNPLPAIGTDEDWQVLGCNRPQDPPRPPVIDPFDLPDVSRLDDLPSEDLDRTQAEVAAKHTPAEPRRYPVVEDVEEAQKRLAKEVNKLLYCASVRLELGIAEPSRSQINWKIDVACSGLLGALTYKLLLMITGESNLFVCDGCGQPYIRANRAPRAGQANYCPNCTSVAQKRAVQRYREKGKKKR